MGPKVLHVFDLGEVGGLFRVVEGLARAQHAAGQSVHVAAVRERGGDPHPILEGLRDSGVSVHVLALPPRAYRRERREIRALIGAVGPDVVHTHGYRSDVLDSGVARSAGAAVVSTVHGFTGGGWKNRIYERLQLRAYRKMDAVVAVSRPLAELLERSGVPADRIRVVPNAWAGTSTSVDPAEARSVLGAPADSFHVGWVGRVSREKGPDVLVEAVRRLDPEGLRVTVVGDGAMRAEQEAASADLPIRWVGAVHDAGRLFGAFDVFVLSSRTEGTPIVLFEAMAAETPVVATAVGGVPDVVDEGSARLVPAERPDALAEAIAAVRRDPSEAGRRAAEARRRLAEVYDSGSWMERYMEIYREAAGRRSGVAP